MSDEVRVPSGDGHAGSTGSGPARLRLVHGGSAPGAPERATDLDLFAGIAAEDQEAFAELYRRYFHELYDYAARVTHDRAAAGDVVQTIFAVVWERRDRVGEVRSPRAWLYRLARNAAIDELRRRRWTTAAEGDQDFDFSAIDAAERDPSEALIERELAELVWSAAETLSPDEYALLDLHVRRELAADELADELGISTGALYTRLSRLRRSFEDALTVALLKRRGGGDCPELGEIVLRLGARSEEAEGRRLLAAHIRDCPACQRTRRRYVTAEALLAGVALVPLTPSTADAIWAKVCALLGLGAAGAAAAGGASHAAAGGAHHGTSTGSIAAHPVVAAVAAAALAVAAGIGVWAAREAFRTPAAAPVAHDPSHVWSPSHAAGRRSKDDRVVIAWSRQPDAVAYSVLWSRLPRQEPDAVPDLQGSATGTTSPALSPGRWYFHLRTQSRGGAWTDTVHLGPFVIVARGAPTPLSPPPPSTGGTAPGAGRPAASPSAGASASQVEASTPAPPTPASASAADGGGAAQGRSDSTPPSGQTVELGGGRYYRRLSIPLVLRPGSDAGTGVDEASGVVQRRSARLADGTCRAWSEDWLTIRLHGSADTRVADGRCYRYRYRIADRAGNRSAFSPPSAIAAVDTTPPAPPRLSLTEDGPSTYADGTTLFYRPSGDGGTFVVAASSADAGSGLAAIDFPALAGGMTPATVSSRAAPPFRVAYTWTTGADESGAHVVTVRDRAGNTATAAFTILPDAVAPTGASVAVSGGPWFTVPVVPLVVGPGSDAGSGEAVGSAIVERDGAALADGRCGAFPGAWSPLAPQDGADVNATTGSCYRYRLSVADNVGNRSASAPSSEARIDTSPPSPPQLTLSEASEWLSVSGTTLSYRPLGSPPDKPATFGVAAVTADPESGIAAVTFPAIGGATGDGVDGTPPYAATYTSSTGLTATGRREVVTRNGAGAVARAELDVLPDDAAPTGASVALAGGPWFSDSVPLVVDDGTDPGAGIDEAQVRVERDRTELDGSGCRAFAGKWETVVPVGGADTSVESGSCYRYRVRVPDNVGNVALSEPSGEAQIDGTPPSPPQLTLRESSPALFVAGSTLFYRPDSDGTFTVDASASDPESGIAEVAFPQLEGASGGGPDTAAPYATTYSWKALTAEGSQTVTARNGAGSTAAGTFVLAPDGVGPSGMAVTLDGGPTYPGNAVRMRIDEGSDAGSGLDAGWALFERDSAALNGETCAPFPGAWTEVVLHGAADTGVLVDTSVVSGTCYRYRVTVADEVGNRSTSPPSGDARVE